jgi:hypothetical protein
MNGSLMPFDGMNYSFRFGEDERDANTDFETLHIYNCMIKHFKKGGHDYRLLVTTHINIKQNQ